MPAVDFSDVDDSSPFAADIAWLADQGITTGYLDGTFRPTGPVNRDAMAAFLFRLEVGPTAPQACATGPFQDVTTAHPFCPHITWLLNKNITTGWPDDTYRPNLPVSREAMAAFLYRVAHDGGRAPACTSSPFSDVPAAAQLCGEIAWLAETKVTTGWPDGTFRPGAPIERQAMAAFLHRFAQLPPIDPPVDPENAPVVSVSAPLAGSMVSGEVPVGYSWQGISELSAVTLTVDGTPVVDGTPEAAEVLWDTASTAEGLHDIAVTVTDAEGRGATSVPVTVFVHHGPDPIAQLEADAGNGTITPEERARYAVYRWFDPAAVPEEYRLPDGYVADGDLSAALADALRDYPSLDPATQAELAAFFRPEDAPLPPTEPVDPAALDAAIAYMTDPGDGASLQPTLAATEWVPWKIECSDNFGDWLLNWPKSISPDLTCRYETTAADFYFVSADDNADAGIDMGVDEVNNLLWDAGMPYGGPNGIPDQLDLAAAAFYDAAKTYRDLGFTAPQHLSVAYSAIEAPMSLPYVGTAYVDFHPEHAVYGMWHEVFHQYEYEYTARAGDLVEDFGALGQSTLGWWLEASAEWAAHQVAVGSYGHRGTTAEYVDARYGYAQQLPDRLDHPGWALTTFIPQGSFTDLVVPDDVQGLDPQYGSFILAEYLEQDYGAGTVLSTWQAFADPDPDAGPLAIDQIAAVLAADGPPIDWMVLQHHLANWDIGDRYTDVDAGVWQGLLDGDRPRHQDLSVGPHNLGVEQLGKGGAFYLEVRLPAGEDPSLVTVSLDAPAVDDAATVQVVLARTTRAGAPCGAAGSGAQPVRGLDESGDFEVQVSLVPDCPVAVVTVVDVDARPTGRPGDSIYGLPVRYDAVTTPVESLLVAGDDILAAAPVTVTAAVTQDGAGYLVDTGGGLLHHDDGVLATVVDGQAQGPLFGVAEIGLNPAEPPNGGRKAYALLDGGDLRFLQWGWSDAAPILGPIVDLATYDGVAYGTINDGGRVDAISEWTTGWATSGTQVEQIDLSAPAAGAALKTDGSAWYVVGGSLVPILRSGGAPGVVVYLRDVVDIAAGKPAIMYGNGYAVQRDGTLTWFVCPTGVCQFGTVAGIEDVVEVDTVEGSVHAFATTSDDALWYVQCMDEQCTAHTVAEAGMSAGGVESVVPAGDDALVLQYDGTLTRVEYTATGPVATVLRDDVGWVSSTGEDTYAVLVDGTLLRWDEVGAELDPVSGIPAISTLACGGSACWVNLR